MHAAHVFKQYFVFMSFVVFIALNAHTCLTTLSCPMEACFMAFQTKTDRQAYTFSLVISVLDFIYIPETQN